MTRCFPVRRGDRLEGHRVRVEQPVRGFQFGKRFHLIRKASGRMVDNSLGHVDEPCCATLVAEITGSESFFRPSVRI